MFKKDFDNFNDGGSVSEWNEGNFKNLRLHEAQEMINSGKVTPFSLSADGHCWNYQLWKAGIDILYGEGQSKYRDEEIKEIDSIKNLIEELINLKPPFKFMTQQTFFGKQTKSISIKENQNKIQKFLDLFEKQVKKYNDAHGLSTRNKDDNDWEGL